MTGGEITNCHNGLTVDGDRTSLVITGGKIRGTSDAIMFSGNDAFLWITGGNIINNYVGIYMEGSDNNVVISGGNIDYNSIFGINIGGSRNVTTITGGSISNNGADDGAGIITGGDSTNGRVIITGGNIANNYGGGVGFHCPGPSFFTMTGGTIRGNEKRGLYLRGPNSSIEKTGGIIYGNNSGSNSNEDGAIEIDMADNGELYVLLKSDAVASVHYKATINAAGTDLVPGFLPATGSWVRTDD